MKLSIKLQEETSNYGTIIGIANLSSVCCLKANHNTAGMSFFFFDDPLADGLQNVSQTHLCHSPLKS